MTVLVVGSGGREHALAWHLASTGTEVRVAPGNGGTPAANVAVQASDIDGLVQFVQREKIDLTIVGPEAPLAAGLVDRFAQEGLKAFGPTQAAARLEWSKAWTKDFLRRHAIPTARAEPVTSESEARRSIARRGLPIVLKADGLAAGKGVFVVTTPAEVDAALEHLVHGLGDAAQTVLVEEYLEGPELSVLAFTDGEHLAMMPPARDYKRLLDGDRGPNTGGMGGYTRPEYATAALLKEIEAEILEPTLAGMRAEGHPYRGVLYAGLMLTRDGPRVLEFNCRFGDPECQLILPLLKSNLLDICESAMAGSLRSDEVRWRSERTFGVVLAARGYPEAPITGDRINRLDALPAGALAFHAGTRFAQDEVVTAGGRVLTLVGGDREAVYAAADAVTFAGKVYRRDIGREVVAGVGG
jgi:phosphoribosylamine---glycine ligase